MGTSDSVVTLAYMACCAGYPSSTRAAAAALAGMHGAQGAEAEREEVWGAAADGGPTGGLSHRATWPGVAVKPDCKAAVKWT
jgi:hypothetical protein